MAGVKGRSGRRARSIEDKFLAIRDKAREVVMEYLCNTSIALDERVKVAAPLFGRFIPQAPLIDQSTHSHISYVWKNSRDTDGISTPRIPVGNSSRQA